MKVETPQILWIPEEDKGLNAALNSVDLIASGFVEATATNEPCHVLVTAGNSNDINLWKMQSSSKMDYMTSLSRHEGPVNGVTFSPDGLHLATAGDTGTIIIWSVPLSKQGNGNGRHFWSSVTREADLRVQIVARTGEGVVDLSWSADSRRLMAGSIDHSVLVMENTTAKENANSNWKLIYRNGMDHTHFVQGVAFDPLGVYLASASSDRTVRVIPRKMPKKKILRRVQDKSPQIPPTDHASTVARLLSENKFELQRSKLVKYRKVQVEDGQDNVTFKRQHLFADEPTLRSFVRRLAWTPDGAFLICPGGLYQHEGYGTYIYARHHFDEPYKVLHGLEKPSVAVAPNPVLFALPENVGQSENIVPYRSLFAVLTWDTVLIYDTIQAAPLTVVKNIHYSNLSDATWSPDGHVLVVSSTDGYLTIVQFEQGELGTVYHRQEELVTDAPKSLQELPVTAPPPKTASPKVPPSTVLPPCEPGQVRVEAPPAKRAKTRVTPTLVATLDAKRPLEKVVTVGVDQLCIDQQPKKKKRIQPTLVSTAP